VAKAWMVCLRVGLKVTWIRMSRAMTGFTVRRTFRCTVCGDETEQSLNLNNFLSVCAIALQPLQFFCVSLCVFRCLLQNFKDLDQIL
jgi:hypothetical protein